MLSRAISGNVAASRTAERASSQVSVSMSSLRPFGTLPLPYTFVRLS